MSLNHISNSIGLIINKQRQVHEINEKYNYISEKNNTKTQSVCQTLYQMTRKNSANKKH